MLKIESIGECRMVKQFHVKLSGQNTPMWIHEEDLLGYFYGFFVPVLIPMFYRWRDFIWTFFFSFAALVNGQASLFQPLSNAVPVLPATADVNLPSTQEPLGASGNGQYCFALVDWLINLFVFRTTIIPILRENLLCMCAAKMFAMISKVRLEILGILQKFQNARNDVKITFFNGWKCCINQSIRAGRSRIFVLDFCLPCLSWLTYFTLCWSVFP